MYSFGQLATNPRHGLFSLIELHFIDNHFFQFIGVFTFPDNEAQTKNSLYYLCIGLHIAERQRLIHIFIEICTHSTGICIFSWFEIEIHSIINTFFSKINISDLILSLNVFCDIYCWGILLDGLTSISPTTVLALICRCTPLQNHGKRFKGHSAHYFLAQLRYWHTWPLDPILEVIAGMMVTKKWNLLKISTTSSYSVYVEHTHVLNRISTID